jgi:hypothetical protein
MSAEDKTTAMKAERYGSKISMMCIFSRGSHKLTVG